MFLHFALAVLLLLPTSYAQERLSFDCLIELDYHARSLPTTVYTGLVVKTQPRNEQYVDVCARYSGAVIKFPLDRLDRNVRNILLNEPNVQLGVREVPMAPTANPEVANPNLPKMFEWRLLLALSADPAKRSVPFGRTPPKLHNVVISTHLENVVKF